MVVTETGIAPAVAPAGVTAVTCDSESTVKPEAAMPPKLTALAPSRSAPLMTTEVPPPLAPEVVPREMIVGGGCTSALKPIASPTPGLPNADEVPSAGAGSHSPKDPRPFPTPTDAVGLMSRAIA